MQGSLFLVYRGETSLLKTPYFQRIYKKLSQTPIFRPFLPIFTYKKLNFWKYHLRKNSSFEINRDPYPQGPTALEAAHKVKLLIIFDQNHDGDQDRYW